jgi:Lon protease-like protein
VLASVLQLLKLPDGTVKVLVEGGRRIEVKRFVDNEAYFEAEAKWWTKTSRTRRGGGADARGVGEVRETM